MDKPQIIGLGLNGLIGSRISELLGHKYKFINLSRSNGVDITDKDSLKAISDYKKADFVIHFSAKTDVDECEKDKDLAEKGEAFQINVLGTENVSDYCRDFGKKIIYISTDFVFDGDLETEKSYTEESLPNPINWYAETKFKGEKIVEESGADYVIVRLAYPYRAEFEQKKDFMRAIKDRLSEGLEVKAITDHLFCPTFIDDAAYALDKLIETDAAGIYHVVGSEAITPFEAAVKIAEIFGFDKGLINKTTREEFFVDRAPRPFNLTLGNAKITNLGINMRSFEEGLNEIKKQLEE